MHTRTAAQTLFNDDANLDMTLCRQIQDSIGPCCNTSAPPMYTKTQ